VPRKAVRSDVTTYRLNAAIKSLRRLPKLSGIKTERRIEVKNKSVEELPRGIYRRGHSLVCYLTIDGKPKPRTIGRVTVKFAEQQRQIWQREILENRYVKPKPRTDLVLVSDICDRGVEYFKNYTRSWDRAECHAARFKEWWPNRTAESITTSEINAKLRENVAPNGLKWSERTSNEYRVSLVSFFKKAIDRGELLTNPASRAYIYKIENSRTRELSLKEEDALRRAIRKLYPHKEPEFDLGLHLMCRASNLYGQHSTKRKLMEPLQWSDVNMDFKTVQFTRSKSGKPYRVPLNKTAVAALKILRERCEDPDTPDGPVIRKPSGIELQSARKWFENCLAEAKIKDFRWHDFRHTAASRLREAGVQIEDIRYLLGHGARSITERYAHASLDVLRKAVAKLDRKPTDTQTDTNTDTSTILRFRTA
jgi:integrase